MIRVLVPPFKAGVSEWRRLAARRSELAALLDAIPEAVLMYDAQARSFTPTRAPRSCSECRARPAPARRFAPKPSGWRGRSPPRPSAIVAARTPRA